MATGSQQEEENWDDDFEFGSSAGSPVMGRRGDTTPPNLSPRAVARKALGNESSRSGLRTPPNSRGRWSSGSIENWDDEDETINFKALANGLSQRPVTPKAQSKPQSGTPTRARKISEGSGDFWDDDDDVDLAKSAGVVPTHPSTPFMSTASSSNTNGTNIKSSELSRANQVQVPQSNIFSPNPSIPPTAIRGPELNGSGTDTSTSVTDIMDSSDSSALQRSDTSASVSASQSSSFFGRLGRRLSKAGSGPASRSTMLSPSVTDDMTNSPFPSAIFSPPPSSNNLTPNSANNSHILGTSPSKSKNGFSFGGGMLKRSGSLSKSARSGKENGTKKANGVAETYSSEVGLGVHIPNASGPHGAAHTAPATFNSRRYTERIIDPSYSVTSSQYAPPGHGHSLSAAGLPRSMAPGWGAPPSPTRHGKAKQVGSLGSVEMLTSLSSKNNLQAAGATPTSPIEESKPTHQPSASISSTFFSSMRRKSNPLQATSKVPNSAMTGAPPPASTLAFARNGLPSMKSATALDEPMQQNEKDVQQSPAPQPSVQSQTQAQRQRRTHRRNVSTGAMITSIIDEVSSDGTVNNKLSAGAMRERPPPLKSGLHQSTTASEIRRAGASTPPPRLSTSSAGSSPPPVSPIEFARASEDSGSFGRRSSSDRAFVLPPSMSIRSPALPTSGIRADVGSSGRRSSDWSPSSSPGDGTGSSGLLPPIELCPPSPPEVQPIKPSKSSAIDRKRDTLTQVGEVDEDKTPIAAPRRRVHHLQIGNGAIVPVASLSKASQLDTPKAEVSQGGLTASISAPVSIASTGSNATLGPNSSGVRTNKHFECVNSNGRTSPGISASLGRLAGASTAGRIDEGAPGPTNSGLTRRNSLSGGVISGTLSTANSMGGGLKIPARISAKQDALKRDLGAVREFALSIDELKRLQFSYEMVLFDVKRLCASGSGPRQTTPFTEKHWYNIRTSAFIPPFHTPRPSVNDAEGLSPPTTPLSPTFEKPNDKRRRHFIRVPDQPTEEPVDESSFIPTEQKKLTTAALADLNLHYAIWWECADLLVELGGAAPPVIAGTAVKSPTLPVLRKPGFSMSDEQSTPRAKGRHATLPKQEPRPEGSITDLSTVTSPDPIGSSGLRRGSTGQQDLNARQIQLLKGMLNTPNPNDLSSSVDFGSLYGTQLQALSPVISNPASTVRNPLSVATENGGEAVGAETQDVTEKERKRNRRISLGLAGKLGVHQILAGLKWTKEKAKQRYKQPIATPDTSNRRSVEFAAADSRTSIDQSQASAFPVQAIARYEADASQSREILDVTSPSQKATPPSPYKRSRRRSLASIFKFGNASANQAEDRSISHSRSRVDLTSPLGYVSNTSSHHTSSRADDSTGPDADSDWDQMNSPSDIPSRYASSQKARSSAQDLSAQGGPNRGRTAPVGVPITNRSRRGSTTGSRNASASGNVYSTASASAASLVSSSVYGSSVSQASFHESFGGRSANERIEEDRRRLKKPPSRQPRRPPSAGGRKSRPSSSQRSSPRLITSSTPPVVMSPIADRAYYSARSATHQSPTLPEYPNHPYPSSSTQSAPMHGTSTSSITDLSQPKLALTPENIVPLLIYAREVKLKLADCLVELKSLESDLILSKVGGEHLDNGGAVEFVPDGGE